MIVGNEVIRCLGLKSYQGSGAWGGQEEEGREGSGGSGRSAPQPNHSETKPKPCSLVCFLALQVIKRQAPKVGSWTGVMMCQPTGQPILIHGLFRMVLTHATYRSAVTRNDSYTAVDGAVQASSRWVRAAPRAGFSLVHRLSLSRCQRTARDDKQQR